MVEATYTVVLTKDGLMAKDNARGTVLWTKSNVNPRTHMVGDGEFVFLYDVNPDGDVSPVRCYRAADGVEVTVPDSSAAFTNVKRSKFYGRKVLAFDDEAGQEGACGCTTCSPARTCGSRTSGPTGGCSGPRTTSTPGT